MLLNSDLIALVLSVLTIVFNHHYFKTKGDKAKSIEGVFCIVYRVEMNDDDYLEHVYVLIFLCSSSDNHPRASPQSFDSAKNSQRMEKAPVGSSAHPDMAVPVRTKVVIWRCDIWHYSWHHAYTSR